MAGLVPAICVFDAPRPLPFVPADAGTQPLPDSKAVRFGKDWIPASAGMNGECCAFAMKRRCLNEPCARRHFSQAAKACRKTRSPGVPFSIARMARRLLV